MFFIHYQIIGAMWICCAALLHVLLLVEAAENTSPRTVDTRTDPLKEQPFGENITQENVTFPPEFPNIRIPLQEMAEFIAETKEHFFSGCVYIVHADTAAQDVLAYRIFSQFQQLLSSLSVHSAVVSFSTLLQNPKKIHCCKNMPLMITLFESEALKHYFQQLWKDQIPELVFNMWITFMQLEDWEEFLAAVNVPFSIQFLIAQPKAGGGILLTEVYRVAPGMPLTSSFYGKWERYGQKVLPNTELYQRRSNLQGLKLIAAAVNGSVTLISEDLDGNKKLISFAGEMWREIENMINFTTTIKVPADGNYGSLDDNGSWNGVVNMLFNREADISATVLDMTSKRATAVDFLNPITFSRYYIFIKKKSWYVPTWNCLLKPFDVYLWLTVLIAVVANAIVLTVISKMGHHFYDEKYFSPSDSLLYVLAALAQQCGSFPRFTSARVVCLCSHLTALVLLALYSASLVSFLTVQEEKLPFHDWKSMIEVGTYRLIVVYSTFEIQLLTANTSGIYNDVFTHLMGSSVNDSPKHYLDGLKRVCSMNNIALLSSDTSLGGLVLEAGCDFSAIPVDMNHIASTFPVCKNSPYRSLLNICLQVMREGGIYQRMWLKYLHNFQIPVSEKEVERRFIEITDILPLLAILGFGCILALLLLALEILSAYVLKKRSYRSQK